MKPVVALVTARAARGLDEDQLPLEQALRAAGAQVEIAAWDEPEVDWTSFDIALLRSTWDYTDRLSEFLSWVHRTSGLTKLFNPPAVVRWNTDKHYLKELASAGVPIVPSTFLEPGTSVAAVLDEFVRGLQTAELVVKPAVGAGSRDTQRYKRSDRETAAVHAQRLLDARRSVLLQPYLDRVDEYGETALIFFAGQFSHAVRKGPMLAQASAAQEAPARGSSPLFLAEQITSRTAAADELSVAGRALAAIPFATPLYARVDLIRETAGEPVLLELELTEPSLFLGYEAGAAAKFAQVVLNRLEFKT